jgi:predicted branched-subunit amino acid permease
LFAESGYTPAQGVAFTIFTFALPGQLIVAEMFAHGAGLAAIAFAVFIVNARLLPLVVSLLPLLRAAKPPRAGLFAAAHLIAVTGWVCFMNGYRRIPAQARWRYFLILVLTLWAMSMAATALGGFAATALPRPLALGLLFLNPAYFLCMIISGLTEKSHIVALIIGIALFPVFYAISEDWALIAAGVVGGTIAFWAVKQ